MVVALRVIDECIFVSRAYLAIFLVQVAISEATAITVYAATSIVVLIALILATA